MARVFRQVDIILQNHTKELLTLEGAVAIQGGWGKDQPLVGSVVAPQGAGRWQSASTTVGVGAEGSLRFGSTKGHIDIGWVLPVDASQPEYTVATPCGLEYAQVMRGESADYRVMVVTLMASA